MCALWTLELFDELRLFKLPIMLNENGVNEIINALFNQILYQYGKLE